MDSGYVKKNRIIDEIMFYEWVVFCLIFFFLCYNLFFFLCRRRLKSSPMLINTREILPFQTRFHEPVKTRRDTALVEDQHHFLTTPPNREARTWTGSRRV